ncbi:MAG: hypothetical protein VZR56_07920 [Treponema sp.]|nr:hypothetical protein [Treponema sp.]
MKKVFASVLFLLNITALLYGEKVPITVVYDDDTTYVQYFDEDTTWWGYAFGEDMKNCPIKNVLGLEQLRNIEGIEIHNARFSDLSFLSVFPNLKVIWIQSCTIKNLDFLTDFNDAEIIDIDFYMEYEDYLKNKDKKLDLSFAKRLQKICIVGSIRDNLNPKKCFQYNPTLTNLEPGCIDYSPK